MKVQRGDIGKFAARLKGLRAEHGLSMEELCAAFNKQSGGKLNKSTIHRYENGLQEPMLTTVAALASFFGVSPTYLIGESDDRSCMASNISNSAVVQGNNATTLIVRNGKATGELSDQAAELLRVFEGLDVRRQTALLSYAFELDAERSGE